MYQKGYITLLEDAQIWGGKENALLEVLDIYGKRCVLTDLAILTGAYVSNEKIKFNQTLSGRTGDVWTKTSDGNNVAFATDSHGNWCWIMAQKRNAAIRPVINKVDDSIFENDYRLNNGILEVSYGQYPQKAVDESTSRLLDQLFKIGYMEETEKTYTFDACKIKDYDKAFSPVTYKEYTCLGKKYICLKANTNTKAVVLSNGQLCHDGDYIWVEVLPVTWIIDRKNGVLVAKNALVSGIRFNLKDDDYENSEIQKYIDNYMLPNIFENTIDKNNILNEEKAVVRTRKNY